MSDDAFAAWVIAGRFDFAGWLNAKMEASYISSRYLAQSLGVSKPAVNAWRRGAGTPEQPNREKIARFFGLDVPEAPEPPQPTTLQGIVFR